MKKRSIYWVYLIPVMWAILSLALAGIANIHPPDHADVLWMLLAPLGVLISLPTIFLKYSPYGHGPSIVLDLISILLVGTILSSGIVLLSNYGKGNQKRVRLNFSILILSVILLVCARLKSSIDQKEEKKLDFMNSFCGMHYPSSTTEINFSDGSVIFVAHVKIPDEYIDKFISENELKPCDTRQMGMMIDPVIVKKYLKPAFREIPASADCFEKPAAKEFPLGKFRIEKNSGHIWMEFNTKGY